MALAKCVVLGAGGFIGSNMVKFLKDKGYFVRAVDIELPEFRKELWNASDEWIEYDLRKKLHYNGYDTIGKEILKGVDWVFQFAADMGGRGYITDDNNTAADNSELINVVVRRALKPGQRLFFPSSACAYPNGVGPTEDKFGQRPCDGPYGEEKLFSALRYLAQGQRVGILSTVYGPYQEYEGERMKFPTAITRKVIEAVNSDEEHGDTWTSHVPHEIEIWGDGTQIRTFQFIDDALEKIYRVMSADKYEGPVNIGSEEEVTIKEVANVLCEHAGIVPHYVFDKSKPTGPLNRGNSNEKFNRLYGEVKETSARDGFIKLYDWLESNEESLGIRPGKPQTVPKN